MSTFRISSFPEGETPVATLRSRGSDTALTPTYTGVAVSGRPSVYEFDIGARANGDYEIDIADPRANYVLRVATGGNTVADDWNMLDLIADVSDVASDVTALGGAVTVIVDQPTVDDGQLTAPIIIGDDYLTANDRDFTWTVAEVPGVVVGTAKCYFGGRDAEGHTWLVEGDITDNGDEWDLTFELTKDDTKNLRPGYYDWSVEVKDASGKEITRVRSNGKVKLVDKQT